MILKGKKYRHINTGATNIVLDIGESATFNGEICVFYKRDVPHVSEDGVVYETHVKPIHQFETMYRRYEI